MIEEIYKILFPYASEKMAEAGGKNTKFVHYTSASTGLSIVKKKVVWMRNALVMNDFEEVAHGQTCVAAALNHEVFGSRLKEALARIDADIWGKVVEMYSATTDRQKFDSYLISVSEHGSGAVDEDKYGRLSMWRAYGGDTNVAIVLNNTPFLAASHALHTYTSPVLYADERRFFGQFARVVENIEKNIDFLSSVGADQVSNMLFNVLLFAVLSTKHPGFSEEREWRVIHNPTLWPSERMKFEIETVDGVPQKVYKLPLCDVPEEGLTGIEPSEFISEIIIGPTEYPLPIYEAYLDVLSDAGIANPESKIKVSGIPLRR